MKPDNRSILPLDELPPPIRLDRDGVARLGGTRVTLDVVIRAFDRGVSAEEIAARYPVLGLADVYAVISYYLRHAPEVTEYLERRREQSAAVRRENETRFNLSGLRGSLLARRATQQPIET